MKTMTRMLMVAMMTLMAAFAVAGDMKKDDGMMHDDAMKKENMSDHGMAKDDMAKDMGQGMNEKVIKDDGMASQGVDDMKDMKKDDMDMMKSDDGMK